MEGRETWPPRTNAVGSKGKGKVVASSRAPPFGEKIKPRPPPPPPPPPPPSLETFMSYLSYFKEPLLKEPEEELIFSLGAVYVEKAIEGV